MATFTDDSGDNLEVGGEDDDLFNMGQGGDDTVQAGGGDDVINFTSSAFTAADRVDGGAGLDVLEIGGIYNAPIVFQPDTMVGIETLLLAGLGYNLILDDNNVAPGEELLVLLYSSGTRVDGGAETDGGFDFQLQSGVDQVSLIGGAGDELFFASDRR